jgi:hypothetical protein
MKIIGNCITFYSSPENFRKELYGSKPNTARILDRKEERAVQAAQNTLKRILITDTHTEQSFERELTDITNFEFTHEDIEIWIFSWKNYKLIDD